jgi:hypothetical protein
MGANAQFCVSFFGLLWAFCVLFVSFPARLSALIGTAAAVADFY